METRRNLRQQTIRPQLFFKVLSKEIINPFHLIESIKTPSNQQLYEQQTTLKIKPSHYQRFVNLNVLFIHCQFPFIWYTCSFDAIDHSIEKDNAYKTDIQPSKGVVLLFSLDSNGVFLCFSILFMFVIVCSDTCLAFFIAFSRFLWIVQFPLLLRLTCNLSVDTSCCFDMSPFSFEQFFLTLTRVVLNQFNLTILSTEFIEYIYCGCLFFILPLMYSLYCFLCLSILLLKLSQVLPL